jgi:hypothetical protein
MPSLLRGVILGVAVIAGYLFALGRGLPTGQARALALATLLAGQTLLSLVERTPDSPVWRMRRGGKVLLITLGLMATVTLAAVFLAPFARLMHLEPFPAAGLLAVAGLAAASTLWAEPVKGRRERRYLLT